MSENGKLNRQAMRSTRLITKTRYELWLWDDNYDWLFRQAKADDVTMARKLNELLAFLKVFHGE